jgi:hypothetical protein
LVHPHDGAGGGNQQGQRGAHLAAVFRDVPELVEAVENYIEKHNESPKPFIWTAKASDILAKVKRARQALHNVQSV